MRRKPIAIQFVAKLPYHVKQDGSWFVSSCPILDVFSQGTTEAEAKTNLQEALSLFFESCFERNTLDTVLRQCGFNKIGEPSIQPYNSMENILDVPISMEWNQPKNSPCHA